MHSFIQLSFIMKTHFFIFAILFSSSLHAQQVKKITLQASGLTCSLCSNSIFKALKTVSFVDHVEANIQLSSFEISIKPNSQIDFDELKRKVEDAGFSVSKFVATIQFDRVWVKNNVPIAIGGETLLLLRIKDQQLDGEKQVLFLDKGFVSDKQFKVNPIAPAGIRIFHATI